MPDLSLWERLTLMIWKNWHIHFYYRKQIIFCIITPFMFTLILVALRFLIGIENFSVSKYNPINLKDEWRKTLDALKNRYKIEPSEYSCFVPRIELVYAPNDVDYVTRIMNAVEIEYLGNIPVHGYASKKELRRAMKSEHYFAGILFETSSPLVKPTNVQDEYPIHLSYSLVFPSELRFYNDSFIGSSWRTDKLYDYHNFVKQRFPYANDGGYVGYVREGFIFLQNAVALTFLKLITPHITIPEIRIQRFAHIAHSRDPMAEGLMTNLSFIILVGFWYPCMRLISFIIRERERGEMRFLHIMGISRLLQLFAWFVNTIIILFMAAILVTIALKIHFVDGFAICSKSSWTALIFLMTVYLLASTSFSFMVCSFFKQSLAAMVFLGLCWMLTYLPFLTLFKANTPLKLLISFLPNSAMGLIFFDVIEFELFGDGFHWNHLFQTRSTADDISSGIIVIILCISTILYALFGLYVRRIRKILHIIPKRYRRAMKLGSRASTDIVMPHRRLTKVFEIEPNFKNVVVEIKSLNKTINDITLVNNVSMNLLDNEIVILMGHNGSGKTLLLSMLTGLLKPTYGTATLFGYDIRKETEHAFDGLGISLQEGSLFPELTPFVQMVFHCRLKGLHDENAINEAHKYLDTLGLSEKSDVVTGELPLNERQYLKVCCALCGQSKFVVLDQPTAGIDNAARKQIWELIISEREARTILITTHSTEEADCLGDRIAIMSGGELKCFGSSFFLRDVYGGGTRLILTKKDNCDSNAVTKAIQKYIPEISPECEIGAELSYRLEEKDNLLFTNILTDLENRSFELNISAISIRETSLDDVFIFMGSEDPSEGENVRHVEIMNGHSIYANEHESYKYLSKGPRYKGFNLFVSQVGAIFCKRLKFNMNLKCFPIMMVLMPTIFTALSFLISSYNSKSAQLPPMTFRLTQYSESITVIKIRNDLASDIRENDILNSYKGIVLRMGLDHKLRVISSMLFTEYILDHQDKEPEEVYHKFLIGASIGYDGLIAWFNNFPLHTAPLSLNILHNAILMSGVHDKRFKISVTNAPLSSASEYFTDDVYSLTSIGNALATNLTYSISILWTISVACLVNERISRMKLLQYISGVRTYTLWLGQYIYDVLRICIASFFIMITIITFGIFSITVWNLAVHYYFMLVFFGMCLLPFYYLLSHLFVDSVLSYVSISTFNIYGVRQQLFDGTSTESISLTTILLTSIGVTFIGFMTALKNAQPQRIAKLMIWPLHIFPHFSLCNALLKIYNVANIDQLCSDKSLYTVSVHIEQCNVLPDCCAENEEWSWKELGVFPEVLSILIFGIVSTITLCVTEWIKVHGGMLRRQPPPDHDDHARIDHEYWHESDCIIDQSIYKEQVRVNTLPPKNYKNTPLVLKSMGKLYKNQKPLQRLFLIVERKECFGILDINFSKSWSPFKVLATEEKLSYGRAYIYGNNLTDNIYSLYKNIGYCPQTDQLIPYYTASEYMEIFGLLRGIPRNKISPICEGLAKVLGFIKQYRLLVKFFNPGHKRRLSVAIALLGNPSVLLLDEPTEYVDLASRRLVWNALQRVLKTGTAILLRSLSTRECERLCTRVGVSINARIQCIGNVEEINARYASGYMLKVKIKANQAMDYFNTPRNSDDIIFTHNPFLKVQSFVETEFDYSRMKDQRGYLLYFVIPFEGNTIAKIFHILQENSFSLNIDTFSVTSAILSIHCMDLADNHRPSERLSLKNMKNIRASKI